MQLTLFLGQILAIMYIVTGLAMIIHNHRFKKIYTEYCEKPAFLALSGFLSLVLGALFVSAHNIWVFNTQGLITLIGWMILIHGILRLIFPEWTMHKCKKILATKNGLMIIAWVSFILGLYLGYMTYYYIPATIPTI